ncbi:shikimate kinase [Actinomyces gaoshouyii]|uniref:shikimate kinase n=1 Tax=Actinomyces gaoshouyii TaxID=1960083 RepID=UPI0009BE64F8|nr:shikimate kinase [Actinomyces gaoshouyii]ARD41656.1 shikimate kinase [Actinomyces gaoshouyii]
MSTAPAIVLIGPPAAGCTTVARALADLRGAPCLDLGARTAARLGTEEELALVAIPEAEYRRVEEAVALGLIEAARVSGGILALGSGCLGSERVRAALAALPGQGGAVVGLTASVRSLTTRNGLDAPRSVALGTIHHEFTRMLREREALCRRAAGVVVDTSDREPADCADRIVTLLDTPAPRP